MSEGQGRRRSRWVPGDVVCLKSGGPGMTVSLVSDMHPRAQCLWFSGDEVHEVWFDDALLKGIRHPSPADRECVPVAPVDLVEATDFDGTFDRVGQRTARDRDLLVTATDAGGVLEGAILKLLATRDRRDLHDGCATPEECRAVYRWARSALEGATELGLLLAGLLDIDVVDGAVAFYATEKARRLAAYPPKPRPVSEHPAPPPSTDPAPGG